MSVVLLIDNFRQTLGKGLPNLLVLTTLADEVAGHLLPAGEALRAKLYPHAGKLAGAVLGSIVDEVVAIAQVLAVGNDHALLESVAKVLR
jgi:hypothetical protein